MRKLSGKLALASVLAFSSLAFAAFSQISDLNKALSKLTEPYNHKGSQVSFVVSKAEVNSERAVALKAKFVVKKAGNLASGALRGEVSYSYPTRWGAQPAFDFSAELDASHGDMTKILGNLGLNEALIRELFVNTEAAMHDTANQFLKEYGDAASVNVKVKHASKDKNGNYRDMAVEIDMKIDLSKLPKETPAEKVAVVEMKMGIDIDLDKSIELKGTFLANKNFEAFRADQPGMKDYIDALLTQNAQAMAGLSNLVLVGDALMEQAVGGTTSSTSAE